MKANVCAYFPMYFKTCVLCEYALVLIMDSLGIIKLQ